MRPCDRLKGLFILQKKALRNLFSIRRISKHVRGHTKPIFDKHGILTVYNIYNYMTLLCTAKLLFTLKPTYLFELMHLEITPSTRNNRIYLPFLKCAQYQSNFCFQGPKLWNILSSNADLCNNITTAPSINATKSRLKKFLMLIQSFNSTESDETWNEFNNSIPKYINHFRTW